MLGFPSDRLKRHLCSILSPTTPTTARRGFCGRQSQCPRQPPAIRSQTDFDCVSSPPRRILHRNLEKLEAPAMAPTKRSAKADAEARVKAHGEQVEVVDAMAAGATRPCRGGLPAIVKFPIAATLSFCMASLGYSLVGELSKGELAAVSRSQDTWGEVAILAGWRM